MSFNSYTLPTIDQLVSEFAFMRYSDCGGIKGVWRVDSPKPGPALGITIHTHGNEPSGLATSWHFRRNFNLSDRLRRGSVLFVLNNLRAAERYFSALEMIEGKEKEEVKRKARFCDHNMNRLPENTFDLKADTRYEIGRAQELRPIWGCFETAFDIHSTLTETAPMIIVCGGLQRDLIRGFPIKNIVTNIDNVQVEKPAMNFYGEREQVRTLAIEAGSHENSSSFECSIACTTALLHNLDMIEGEKDTATREYDEYFIDGSVLFPDQSFEMVKVFEMFEPITEGQVLAHGKGTRIVADFNGHALMGRPPLKPDSIKEEVLFLSRPVKKITV